MPLEIGRREREGIEILDLKGRLTFGHEDICFREELSRLELAGTSRVVLNLNGVSEMDTTGLGTLLFAFTKLQKAGGGLALVDLNRSHISVLVKARLEVVFDVFKEDHDAINSFFPERDVQCYDILEFIEAERTSPK